MHNNIQCAQQTLGKLLDMHTILNNIPLFNTNEYTTHLTDMPARRHRRRLHARQQQRNQPKSSRVSCLTSNQHAGVESSRRRTFIQSALANSDNVAIPPPMTISPSTQGEPEYCVPMPPLMRRCRASGGRSDLA